MSDAAVEALKKKLLAVGDQIKVAVRETGKDIADELDKRGRFEIASGLGSVRAVNKWNVSIKESGFIVTIRGALSGFWSIFQTGGTIQGKPILWIPLPGTDAVGVRPKNYPGGLFRVVRSGKPLLGSIRDKQIKYVGVSSVTMPRRLNLGSIGRDVASKAKEYFSNHFRI